MEATIKLFKALPIKERKGKEQTKELLRKTIIRGFIFAPEVIYDYSNYDELINMVEKIYGITGEKANASFHKSWKKVRDANIERLTIEQIAHYLTTYGKESPGAYLFQKEHIENWGVDNLSEKVLNLEDFKKSKIFDKDYVYIPKEVLDIPRIKADDLKLVIIKGYTKEEIKDKLLKLLNSGIALKEDTIKDVTDVALFVDVNVKEVEAIKNKEVRVILYNYLNLIPENPLEFLRNLVYVATDKTLLIKNKELIGEIKEKKNIKVIKLLKDYDKKYGLEKLSSIFYRFKPIWLAFRTNRELKTIINKMRKSAIIYHKPMTEDYLNTVTAKIKKGKMIDIDRLESELERVNTFRKARLLYALRYRLCNDDKGDNI